MYQYNSLKFSFKEIAKKDPKVFLSTIITFLSEGNYDSIGEQEVKRFVLDIVDYAEKYANKKISQKIKRELLSEDSIKQITDMVNSNLKRYKRIKESKTYQKRLSNLYSNLIADIVRFFFDDKIPSHLEWRVKKAPNILENEIKALVHNLVIWSDLYESKSFKNIFLECGKLNLLFLLLYLDLIRYYYPNKLKEIANILIEKENKALKEFIKAGKPFVTPEENIFYIFFSHYL